MDNKLKKFTKDVKGKYICKNMTFNPYGKIYSLVGGGIRTGTKSLSITMGE